MSNLARPSSGHVYFSLKDSDALLHCVWFKHAQRREEKFDPLTGEVFEDGPRPSLAHMLTNGQEILCAGSLSVYAPRGSYQLTVSLVQEGGRGALYAAFEALKVKLMGLGYFATERKRSLPYNPQKVAVVTSAKGAAIYDFLRIAQGAGTGSAVRIYPVPVQGDMAATAIAQSFAQINAEQWADVIVLIRGGGSLEDLWAFNEEAVARAIYDSALPVLAGIGHEVDVSIADMTADVRAATPTHAAQLLWPSREELSQTVDGCEWALHEAIQKHVQRHEQSLSHGEQALKWLSPLHAWHRKEEFLQQSTQRLRHCMWQMLEHKERQLEQKIQALPQGLRQVELATTCLEKATMRLKHAGQQLFAQKEQAFCQIEHTLPRCMQQREDKYHHALQALEVQLEAVNPLAPLKRGYALVQQEDGTLVRSVQNITQGQKVHMQVADGRIAAVVQNTETFPLK